MKKTLKSIVNQANNPNKAPDAPQIDNRDIQNRLDAYKDKDENQLMEELMRNITIQKANGSFSPNSVDRLVQMVSPMLNNDQRRKMNDIINKIK